MLVNAGQKMLSKIYSHQVYTPNHAYSLFFIELDLILPKPSPFFQKLSEFEIWHTDKGKLANMEEQLYKWLVISISLGQIQFKKHENL